jgi:hypothetical protein
MREFALWRYTVDDVFFMVEHNSDVKSKGTLKEGNGRGEERGGNVRAKEAGCR